MLDLALYPSIRLHPRPPVQRLIAELFLRFDYRRVQIVLEGSDRIPDGPVLYAMNHTDNFNYWPFQYGLYRQVGRYTATWVKGKNYEHPVVATFMKLTNNIPVASRGYLVTRDFIDVMGRRPHEDEYRALRDAVDALGDVDASRVPAPILERPRAMLGRAFDPGVESYPVAMNELFRSMMRRFVDLNRHAFAIGLDVLVFPQGTRSIRLSRGHIGLAQGASALGATIVPVGCNGCDLVYPGRSFVARPGRIVYRIGEPIEPRQWKDLLRDEIGEPFSREAEVHHRDRFQALTDRVMERIDGLLDERHRFTADGTSEGTRGTDRFV